MGDLYHVDVFMPDELIEKAIECQRNLGRYTFSRHLNDWLNWGVDYKHAIDRGRLIEVINDVRVNPVTPFEIEVEDNELTKIVVRLPYSEDKDVSIAIGLKTNWGTPLIKTAWLNSIYDVHGTLDVTKYIQG